MILPFAAVALWEYGWWIRRRALRGQVFREALVLARQLGRPLVVIGAPDSGPTDGYPCGDITIDIGESACPSFVRADITQRIPLADDSAVVFVSCVLEYVSNVDAAMHEILRVAGNASRVFIVRVEPWTLTAWFYPGTKRRL